MEKPNVDQKALDAEQQLVAAAQADPDQFGVLYQRYVNEIYRYCLFRVRHKETAEDLTSQIFMKALQALPRFRWQDVRFSAWLYRIAHNEVIDYYRRSKPQVDLEDVAFKLFDPQPLASATVIEKEEQAALWSAVQELPEHYQQIIHLKFNEERTYREIGQSIGRSESAVKMLFFRCFRKLHEQLQSDQHFSV